MFYYISLNATVAAENDNKNKQVFPISEIFAMQIKRHFSRSDCATVYNLVSHLMIRTILHLLISLVESQIDFNFQAFWQGNSTSVVTEMVNNKQEFIS